METAIDLLDLYKFSGTDGIVVPRIENVKTIVEEMFLDTFGSDLDLTTETPVGRLVEALTILFQSTLGVTAQNANQFNINSATGIYLDSLGQVYGISRSKEEHTVVRVTVGTTNAGVTIPAGSIIEDRVTKKLFRIRNAIVVPANSSSGSGYAEAVDPGPIEAKADNITAIKTGVLGWLTVTNEDAETIGRNIETDEEFRERLIDSRPIGMAFLQSVYSRVSRVEGVTSCVIYENNRAGTILQNGVAVPGHSLFVCVQNGDDNEIARAIAETKTPGTGLASALIPYENGSSGYIEPVLVQYSSGGIKLDVYFYRPVTATVYVDVEVDVSLYTGTNVEQDIKSAIDSYVKGTGIGDRITGTDIIKATTAYLPTVVPTNVHVSLAEGEQHTAIQLRGFQIGRCTQDSIKVFVV